MYRRRMQFWLVVVMVPMYFGITWLVDRSEAHGRGLLILDTPGDVSVAVGDDVLRPCKDEYEPKPPCPPALTPGGSRRYRWSVIRGKSVEVWAHRAGASARFSLAVPTEGATPHLVLDEAAFQWHPSGGTRLDERGSAVFVDDEGRVTGLVGREAPGPNN